jgi:hypothetical protein
VAEAANGKQSKSPQPLTPDISVEETLNRVAGFSSYTDRKHKYIELSWRRHEKAKKYRIYKAQELNLKKQEKKIPLPDPGFYTDSIFPGTGYGRIQCLCICEGKRRQL